MYIFDTLVPSGRRSTNINPPETRIAVTDEVKRRFIQPLKAKSGADALPARKRVIFTDGEVCFWIRFPHLGDRSGELGKFRELTRAAEALVIFRYCVNPIGVRRAWLDVATKDSTRRHRGCRRVPL